MYEVEEKDFRLVWYVINKNFSEVVERMPWEREELFGYGCIGLAKASLKFDESKGYDFSTLACTCIRNSIAHYVNRVLRKRNNTESRLSINMSIEVGKKSELENIIGVEFDFTNTICKEIMQSIRNNFDDECNNIVSLRLEGLTQKQIAEALGITQIKVYRKLKDLKDYIYHNRKVNRETSKHRTEKQINSEMGKIIDLYSEGLSYSKIGEQMDMQGTLVKYYIERANLASGISIAKQKVLGNKINIDVLDNNLSFLDVARKYEISEVLAKRLFNKFGEVS